MSLVAKAQAKVTKAKDDVATCKDDLHEDTNAVKEAEKAFRFASKEFADCDPNLKKNVDDKSKCQTVYKECFLVLKSGPASESKTKSLLDKLAPILKMMDCESSLLTALGPALRKSTTSRGPFEQMAIDGVENVIKNHVLTLQEKIDKADTLKAEKKEKKEAAQHELNTAKEKVKEKDEALKEAGKTLKEAEKFLKEAKESAAEEEAAAKHTTSTSDAIVPVADENDDADDAKGSPGMNNVILFDGCNKGEFRLSKTEKKKLSKELNQATLGGATLEVCREETVEESPYVSVESLIQDPTSLREIEFLKTTAEADPSIRARPRRRGIPGHWMLDTNVLARQSVSIPIFDKASYKPTRGPTFTFQPGPAVGQMLPLPIFDAPAHPSTPRSRGPGVARAPKRSAEPKEFTVPTISELESLQNRIENLGDNEFTRLMNFLRVNFGVKSDEPEIEIRIQDFTPEQQRQLVDFVDAAAKPKKRRR